MPTWLKHRKSAGPTSPVSPPPAGNPVVVTKEDQEQLRDDAERPKRLRAIANDYLQQPQILQSIESRTSELLVACITWNVAEREPISDMRDWLQVGCAPDIIAVTLQEVDMSWRALAHEQSPRGAQWLQNLHQQLGGLSAYKALTPTQVVGLMLVVFVKTSLSHEVHNVASDVVRLGKVGRGNKAGIGLRLTLRNRTFCFVVCHLAQNINGLGRRNDSYHTIAKEMHFDVSTDRVDLLSHLARDTSAPGSPPGSPTRQHKVGILVHDYIFWFGDLNYRIEGLEEGAVKGLIAAKKWTELLSHDQLRQAIETSAAFAGFEEPRIDWAPTYKYLPGSYEYASTTEGDRKLRIPAYCDRVLYQAKQGAAISCRPLSYQRHELVLSDHRPVSCLFSVKVSSKIDPAQAKAILEEVWSRADYVESRTWSRRQLHRYVDASHEALVEPCDTNFSDPAVFSMRILGDVDDWAESQGSSGTPPGHMQSPATAPRSATGTSPLGKGTLKSAMLEPETAS